VKLKKHLGDLKRVKGMSAEKRAAFEVDQQSEMADRRVLAMEEMAANQLRIAIALESLVGSRTKEQPANLPERLVAAQEKLLEDYQTVVSFWEKFWAADPSLVVRY
jgi:hypothetical protein